MLKVLRVVKYFGSFQIYGYLCTWKLKTINDMKKALDYVRQNVDMGYVNYLVSKAMEMRCPTSYVDAVFADDVQDLLEEYGDDNDLPEGWWLEYGDIDDILTMI